MIITAILLFILIMADQVTKYLVEIHIAEGQVREAIPHILELTKYYNTGAGFSMLEGKTIILVIISALATIFIGWYAYKNNWKKGKLNAIAVTLALAGCFGNLIDRFVCVVNPSLREGVVDMIILLPLDNLWKLITGGHFAIFNVADAYLVVGIILFMIDQLFVSGRKKS